MEIVTLAHVGIEPWRIQPAHFLVHMLHQVSRLASVGHGKGVAAQQFVEQTAFSMVVFADHRHGRLRRAPGQGVQALHVAGARRQYSQHIVRSPVEVL